MQRMDRGMGESATYLPTYLLKQRNGLSSTQFFALPAVSCRGERRRVGVGKGPARRGKKT